MSSSPSALSNRDFFDGYECYRDCLTQHSAILKQNAGELDFSGQAACSQEDLIYSTILCTSQLFRAAHYVLLPESAHSFSQGLIVPLETAMMKLEDLIVMRCLFERNVFFFDSESGLLNGREAISEELKSQVSFNHFSHQIPMDTECPEDLLTYPPMQEHTQLTQELLSRDELRADAEHFVTLNWWDQMLKLNSQLRSEMNLPEIFYGSVSDLLTSHFWEFSVKIEGYLDHFESHISPELDNLDPEEVKKALNQSLSEGKLYMPGLDLIASSEDVDAQGLQTRLNAHLKFCREMLFALSSPVDDDAMEQDHSIHSISFLDANKKSKVHALVKDVLTSSQSLERRVRLLESVIEDVKSGNAFLEDVLGKWPEGESFFSLAENLIVSSLALGNEIDPIGRTKPEESSVIELKRKIADHLISSLALVIQGVNSLKDMPSFTMSKDFQASLQVIHHYILRLDPHPQDSQTFRETLERAKEAACSYDSEYKLSNSHYPALIFRSLSSLITRFGTSVPEKLQLSISSLFLQEGRSDMEGQEPLSSALPDPRKKPKTE